MVLLARLVLAWTTNLVAVVALFSEHYMMVMCGDIASNGGNVLVELLALIFVSRCHDTRRSRLVSWQ